MSFYYFNDNKDDKGRHEVHTKECSYLPNLTNRTLIGYHFDCEDAIKDAKSKHPSKDFDGCFWCSRDCHKG